MMEQLKSEWFQSWKRERSVLGSVQRWGNKDAIGGVHRTEAMSRVNVVNRRTQALCQDDNNNFYSAILAAMVRDVAR
jgi:hypothetical protein